MAPLAALLRGINLGRHRRVSMAALRELLEEMGYHEVRTQGQSGNVVLKSAEPAPDVARAIEKQLGKQLGLDVDVTVRSAEELAAVVAADPLGAVATDPARHLVAFLSTELDPASVRQLAEQDFSPEQFSVRGREIHLWCPNGVGDSRLSKALTDRRLGPAATVRNWSTVTKVLAMLDGSG